MNKITSILSSLFAIAFLFAPVGLTAQESSVEEVVVTGSYLKSSAKDGASAVEVIGRDTIEDLGASTAADIIRNIAVDSGSENNPDSFTSGSTQGTSNVNLRGLGLSSTLVLVDGRRQTIAAGTSNDGAVFVDTNMIPMIATERVEILKEGAASIYGSDAVAGVVNFILRRDFEGIEFNLSQQNTDMGDQTDDSMGVIWGTQTGNTNVVMAYSQLDRSPLAGTELSDYSELAVSGFGNSFALLHGAFFGGINGGTIGAALANPTTDVTSGPYAGTYYLGENVPDANCEANAGILVPTANIYGAVPGLGGFNNGQRCGFYYGDRFNLVNTEEHSSVYLSSKTSFDNGVNFEFDYMATDIDVLDNPQSPSYPALSYLGKPIFPGVAGSPFAVPVLWIGRALGSAFPSPLAPRNNTNERISFGFNGTMMNGNTWEVHFTDSEQVHSYFQPDTSTSRFDAAINGVGGASGTESWNLFDPSANSAELIAYISSGERRKTVADLMVLDFLVTGTTDGGVDFATGLQMKKEGYNVERNDESKAVFGPDGSITQQSDLIFLGGGLENKDSRNSTAIFAEASKDVSDKLQVIGAARYEQLTSDSTFDPKVSMRYQMNDNLVLRGSYSTSFREASLSQLSTSLVALQGLQDFNPDGTRKGSTAFIRVAVAHNPDLEPETSENTNFGAIWTPNDQTSLSVDYWGIDYENVITIENAQGKIVADPTDPDIKRISGTLVGVTTEYQNAENVEATGLDIEGSYNFDTAWGQATVGFNTARILSYEIPNGSGGMRDVVGLFNYDNFARSMPETKSVISAKLSNGDHNFAAYIRMISEYETTRALDALATSRGFSQDVDSFTTLDLRYSYDMEVSGYDVKLSAGINNATDEAAPIVYDAANFSYDPKHHDPRGQMVFLGIKVSK
ncbi:TonB-dependent receptor [Gammaproteobacteria bacterium]|nr:TonB-dependent receptor [Gammaproteobacteria bacterium]MDA9266451.1 TonB-dependent receptor [Gammaproteobacteria bacterium]MDB9984536.1 TonB-dependent receptor [Gammaproteobacteria bacterium]MDC1470768.1 TonB-dependent receptor [Gammaproteobacteria bacterium]